MHSQLHRLLLSAILLTSAAAPCRAEVTKLPASERGRLNREPTRVELLRSMRKLPRAVTAACASVTAGHVFDLAEPGEPFQVTDVIDSRSKPLPSRRLIWAAQMPGRYL